LLRPIEDVSTALLSWLLRRSSAGCTAVCSFGRRSWPPSYRSDVTGDISAEMLADFGCAYVILGHSERRHGHGETDVEELARRARAAMEHRRE
jgi:triosephosphate isomerase